MAKEKNKLGEAVKIFTVMLIHFFMIYISAVGVIFMANGTYLGALLLLLPATFYSLMIFNKL